MLDMWTPLVKNIAILSALLLIATLLKSRLKILQNFYVPNSIIAGFLGLLLGDQVFRLFSIPSDTLKDYIYHLLGITFIAISLKKSNNSKCKNAVSTGFAFAFGYGIQAFLGFGLSLLVLSKIFPKFNPINGILVQLGFSNSPAIASNIARGWEKVLLANSTLGQGFAEKTGIIYSSDIGLTFGAIGFIIACIAGVIIIKYGVKKGYTVFLKNESSVKDSTKTGYIKNKDKQLEAGRQTTNSEAIDTLSIHVSLILIIYIMTYYLLKLILFGFGHAPEGVAFLGQVVVNFHFILGAFIAIIVKKIMTLLKIDFIIDNGISERISGLSVDFMVTASLAAISIAVVIDFMIPIIIISTIVGVATFLYCAYFGSRGFKDYKFERIITVFGIATGTMATGMALLRVVDPDFKSPIASETMYGSGLVFFFTMPIMILINLPLKALVTGNGFLDWLSLILVGSYTILILILWRITGLIKFGKPHGKIFQIDKSL